MDAVLRELDAFSESTVQEALLAHRNNEYASIRACAHAYRISHQTLLRCMAGHDSRPITHECRQILSNVEERTLVRWLTRLTSTGFPAAPALAIKMAEEIRRSRYQPAQSPRDPPSYRRPIGKSWLDRFRKRHPEIQGVWTQKIESVRHTALSVEVAKTWFEAVTEVRFQYQHSPDRVYNMDESGFAVGESQSSRALVNVQENSS